MILQGYVISVGSTRWVKEPQHCTKAVAEAHPPPGQTHKLLRKGPSVPPVKGNSSHGTDVFFVGNKRPLEGKLDLSFFTSLFLVNTKHKNGKAQTIPCRSHPNHRAPRTTCVAQVVMVSCDTAERERLTASDNVTSGKDFPCEFFASFGISVNLIPSRCVYRADKCLCWMNESIHKMEFWVRIAVYTSSLCPGFGRKRRQVISQYPLFSQHGRVGNKSAGSLC